MTAPDATTSTANADRSVRRFIPVTIALPVLGSALGIDGGAIFQIFASEDLGLSATAIGTAFGLGVVSLPVQVLAARMPLRWALRNLQAFLVVAAAQTWVLAVLVATGSASSFAGVALAVTVLAEVSISVLFATSWQPLLSQVMSSVQRQRINARGRAAGGALLAVALVVFAALDRIVRVGFLVLVGAAAVWSAVGLRGIAAPGRVDRSVSGGSAKPSADSPSQKQPISTATKRIYLVLGLVNCGALPLLLIYVHAVLWPTANLGIVGALQLGGSLLASLAWRPTATALIGRARRAGGVLVAATVVLATLRTPVRNRGAEIALLAAIVVAAAALTTIRIALVELAHRCTAEASSVRAFTLLDVVASTSLQLGLLVGGFLVASSARASEWVVAPYGIYVVACSVAAAVAIGSLREAAKPVRARIDT